METETSAQLPFQKIFFGKQSKITQKQISKFSGSAQFCLVSFLCSKYFFQNCSSKTIDSSKTEIIFFIGKKGDKNNYILKFQAKISEFND